jgi:palmitoyltransferase ZDHHC14/18
MSLHHSCVLDVLNIVLSLFLSCFSSLCDNCVVRFDHHCVWIGNCVGQRNYGYFLWFVTSTTLLLLYTFATSLAQVIVLFSEAAHFTDTLFALPPNNTLPAFAFIFYAVLLFFPLTGLVTYHWYISSRDLTTYEDIKERYEGMS